MEDRGLGDVQGLNQGRPALLVLVRHAESERNVAKKGNRFFLDEEARKAVHGVPTTERS